MEFLMLGFRVVFPIFVYIAIGYTLKLVKFYDQKGVKVINDIVFKVFLPCLLFYNVYTTEIGKVFNTTVILYAVCFILLLFVALMAIVPAFIKENSRRGVFIQSVFRSNFALYGLPVTITIMGEGNAGLTSVCLAILVPLYNVLAVICLETFRGNKINFKSIISGIAKNPLIISSVAGILFLLLKIQLPTLCLNVIRDLSRVATPLALVGLGGTLTFRAIGKNKVALFWVILLKLVILPLVAIGIGGYIFGIRGVGIVTLISIFSAPTAVSSFTMAQSMGGDTDLAAQIVVFTSMLSILTVFIVVAITKYLGLF